MKITAGLATKAALGTGIAGVGGLGIYLTADYNSNRLSKYEVALVNFLNGGNDHDIVFSVKKGSDANQELADSDITLANSSPQEVSVSATVQVSSGTSSAFKKGSSSATENDKGMKEIKELNKGNWTWKCTFKFTKDSSITDNNLTIKDKDRIFEASDKGLFGILKKDLYSYTYSQNESKKWTKQALKKVKMDFITNCGYARSTSDNKKINGEADATDSKTIESKVGEFVFDKKESDNKLSFRDTTHFDIWFKEEYATNTYGS